MNELNAPTIDYAGISPLIALTAGTCVTLLVGLLPARRRARHVRDGRAADTRDRVRALRLAVRRAEVPCRRRDALGRPRAVARLPLLHGRGRGARSLAARAPPPPYEPRRLLGAAARERHRHGRAGRRHKPRHAVPRYRAPLDPAVRHVRARPASAHVAGGRAQVPGDRLGRLRDPAVRARLHLRRERLHRLRPDRGLDLRVRPHRRPAAADRNRARARRAWRSRPRWRRSTSGRPTCTRVRPRP